MSEIENLNKTEKLKREGIIWCDINELLALAKKKEAEDKK